MPETHSKSQSLREPQLSRLQLVSVIFFTVSGGAYGLESLVNSLNAGWAIALIVLTPLLWSLPIALMVAELTSALPQEGGYYIWVREGLGTFWGFQEGWWTMCYTAVDMAIYPVLFVNYLGHFYPSLAFSENGAASWKFLLARWLVAVMVIATAFIANWRGVRVVGQSAVLTTAFVLGPFALLAIIGFARHGALAAALFAIRKGLTQKYSGHLLALGVSTALWNYSGWDNVSTFAAEVKKAPRNYPPALAFAQLLIVISYVVPVVAGVGTTTNPALWSESAGWPAIAYAVGGRWLAVVVAGTALVSAWSMFNSQLLYASRLPYAMARDGWLPSPLGRVSNATGMPTIALATACAISALFAALPFSKLVVIDILLYSAALLLEFLALIALRMRKPEMERPFRVPGGWLGVLLATTSPMCFALVVAVASVSGRRADLWQAGVVLVLLLMGTLLYRRDQIAVK